MVSESRETTFDRDISSMAELERILGQLTRRLCETLTTQGRRGRTIGIKIRLDDFSTHTGRGRFRRPSPRPSTSPRWPSSCSGALRRRGRCGCWGCGLPASSMAKGARSSN